MRRPSLRFASRWLLILAIWAAPVLQSAMAFAGAPRAADAGLAFKAADSSDDLDGCGCPCCGMGAIAHNLICLGGAAIIADASDGRAGALSRFAGGQGAAVPGISPLPDPPPPKSLPL
jgi:hypothetical protein